MKTKIIFLKKVASLCFLLILFFFNSRSYSQIIYTDIPDATPNATYPLDLNNDSIVDFLIQFDLGDKVMCKPQNNNAYSGNFIGGVYLPWALSTFASICDTLATWYDSNNSGTMAWGTSIGYWPGATNKYLALKLIVGTNTYYGWARIDILATSTSFTIKDYAYQSTPNACIQTGQTSSGISENSGSPTFSMFPNPFITSTTIQTIGDLKNATLTIYNSYGQTLKQVKNISGQTVSLSRDNLPSGLYFIRLIEENKIIAVEKLIIID
ncbi:MAG: T9SS type A sorting domain-containing protein [Bacteroidetes bacterium]|nr:T9SS type A sorting domain-containing protein [Bacteroidota bacterium]